MDYSPSLVRWWALGRLLVPAQGKGADEWRPRGDSM